MHKFTYKNFRFILKDVNCDTYYKPKSVDLLLVYEILDTAPEHTYTTEIEFDILNALDSIAGCLIISDKDEQFDYMMSVYKNSVFDCVSVETDPSLLTMDDTSWLEQSLIEHLNDNNKYKIKHLFINI